MKNTILFPSFGSSFFYSTLEVESDELDDEVEHEELVDEVDDDDDEFIRPRFTDCSGLYSSPLSSAEKSLVSPSLPFSSLARIGGEFVLFREDIIFSVTVNAVWSAGLWYSF
ncbi:unnamed protein product [Pieris macdunnoughi]|uniref:Uncharacterized protein n=1 Tax=Pieris macdunnoughi TaxID=345717 RepID=A0A821XIR0_9NEOP|nr:unnamed protein product [Pieris macdunnoughi]